CDGNVAKQSQEKREQSRWDKRGRHREARETYETRYRAQQHAVSATARDISKDPERHRVEVAGEHAKSCQRSTDSQADGRIPFQHVYKECSGCNAWTDETHHVLHTHVVGRVGTCFLAAQAPYEQAAQRE